MLQKKHVHAFGKEHGKAWKSLSAEKDMFLEKDFVQRLILTAEQ
jgi:hypothetical protein